MEEGGLNDFWVTKVCGDLAADLVVDTVYGDLLVFFSFSFDSGYMKCPAFLALFDFLLCGSLDSSLLAALEEAKCGFVGLVSVACIWTL